MSNESGSSGCLRNLIIIFAIGGGLLWCTGNNFRQQAEKAEVAKQAIEEDTSWMPDGFIKYNNELAIGNIRANLQCTKRSLSCFTWEVLPRYGCNSLSADWTLLDKNKRNVGYTTDRTTNVKAGQIAVLQVRFTYGGDRGASTHDISKMICN